MMRVAGEDICLRRPERALPSLTKGLRRPERALPSLDSPARGVTPLDPAMGGVWARGKGPA